jgi:uncharacterized membrane protein
VPLFGRSGAKADRQGSTVVGRQRLYRFFTAVFALAVVAAVITCGVVLQPKDYWPAVVACALGALLAVAELVARYRDDPAAAVLSLPAAVYVGVNAVAAGVALYLIHVFGWTFGASGPARQPIQVLAAGFGSAALFRSAVFIVPIGDQLIGIGPQEILNVILAAADRAVDRRRALIRATRAAQIMKDLSFEHGADSIFAYCLATMQNVRPEEAEAVKAKISKLRYDDDYRDMHDTIKAYILGLELLTLVGDHVLSGAAEELKTVLAYSRTRDGGQPSKRVSSTQNQKREMILKALRKEGGEMPLDELRKQVRLNLDESYIIEDLKNEGLVKLQPNEDGNELIQIIDTTHEGAT